jgi:hypothetical protein
MSTKEPLEGSAPGETELPVGNSSTLMEYTEFGESPAGGSFMFIGSATLEGGRLVFLLDCSDCEGGVKEIPLTSGMMVTGLANTILGHRELHADLVTTYAQDLIAATLHNKGPLAGQTLPQECPPAS